MQKRPSVSSQHTPSSGSTGKCRAEGLKADRPPKPETLNPGAQGFKACWHIRVMGIVLGDTVPFKGSFNGSIGVLLWGIRTSPNHENNS